MKKSFAFLAAVFLLVLPGCAAKTVQHHPYPDATKVVDKEGHGRVYVIRPPGGRSSGMHSLIYVDNEVIGQLGPGSFIAFEREPGTIKVTAKVGFFSKSVDVNLEAGKQTFLQTKVQHFPFIGFKPWMREENARVGKGMLDGSKPGKVE